MGRTNMSKKQLKKILLQSAMKGEWNAVVSIYKEHPDIHAATVTRTGETALHIAASDNQDDVVDKLVRLIMANKQHDPVKVLEIENERGNTPLHFAASMGSVRMCEGIARNHPSLVGIRNHESETPLFLAALLGKKEAFLCLNSYISDKESGYSYCRRKDGQTILHSAINGGYFDLAFQIIHLYEKLVYSVNERGQSPLHILATKASAFGSGTHLGRWRSIIYHCIFVEALQPGKAGYYNESKKLQRKASQSYPPNYKTCLNFLRCLSNIFQIVVMKIKAPKPAKQGYMDDSGQRIEDMENPQAMKQNSAQNSRDPKAISQAQGHQLFPSNYGTCFEFIKVLSKAMMVILGLGSTKIKKIQLIKENHIWSIQVMNELLQRCLVYEYDHHGGNPYHSHEDNKKRQMICHAFPDYGHVTLSHYNEMEKETEKISSKCSTHKKQEDKEEKNEQEITLGTREMRLRETQILIATKHGITEMVERILELIPEAAHDTNSEKKNVVLLAVENRQPHMYELLLKRNKLKDSIFHQVDEDGNSALHLAAKLGEYKPWLIPGAALQMQWEIKWFQFVKNSMPKQFFVLYNKEGKTAKDIFTKSHEELVKSGGEWLAQTSESCSVVAALIAAVAFATSTAVPGGTDKTTGAPILEKETAFDVFAISSLISLCFSVTSVVLFLAILTSRYQERDFAIDLPRKLLMGLTSLFISIVSVLVSFCAGHFFILRDRLKYVAYPVYATTCLPMTLFAAAQFPLYFDLTKAIFKKVPQRSYKVPQD